MGERYIIIDDLQIVYAGYFKFKDLQKLIHGWLVNKGYTLIELKNIVQVTSSGRNIELELAPNRKFNDNAKAIISILIKISKMKDTIVGVGDYEEKVNSGNIHIQFASMLETDYEGTWRTKYPFFSFLRVFVDKYVYSAKYRGFQETVFAETMELHDEIKAYLNLDKY